MTMTTRRSRRTAKPIPTRRQDIGDHLDRVYGNRKGYACIAYKERSDGDRGGPFKQDFHRWPEQRGEIIDHVVRLVDNGLCVWAPTSLFTGRQRRDGGTVPSNVLSFELDQVPPLALDLLSSLGADLINSGSDGHLHVNIFLDEDLLGTEIKELGRQIARACGYRSQEQGGKYGDGELLRVVGTQNTKPGVDERVSVHRVGRSRRVPTTVAKVREHMSFFEPYEPAVKPAQGDAANLVPTLVDQAKLSREIRTMLRDEDEGDGTQRHRRTKKLVRLCNEAGLSQDEALWVLNEHEPTCEKFTTEARRSAQVVACWDADTRPKAKARKKDAVETSDTGGKWAAYAGDASLDDVWACSDITRHIRAVARGQIVGPMTLLLSVMTHATMLVPPHIVLPSIVGGYGSLNMFVGLVSPSGGGKGASSQVVDTCIHFERDVDERNIGTGEGITSQYGKWTGDKATWDRTSVLFTAPEIGTLGSLTNRSGATGVDELCKAWSGEKLGFSNRSAETSIQMHNHRYRMGFIAGVQPAKAGVLLDHIDGGFPQRWLFADPHDPGAGKFATPEPIDWPGNAVLDKIDTPDDEMYLDKKQQRSNYVVLEVPAHVEDSIRDFHIYRSRGGEIDPMDSHTMLMRLKVAASFAFLHGRFEAVTDADWDMAGAIMRHHRETRTSMMAKMYEARAADGKAKAKAAGANKAIQDEAQHAVQLRRVVEAMRKMIASFPEEGIKGADFKKPFRSAVREQYFEEAEALLIESGELVKKTVTRSGKVTGYRYLRPDVVEVD